MVEPLISFNPPTGFQTRSRVWKAYRGKPRLRASRNAITVSEITGA
jgi:hypothetical protein